MQRTALALSGLLILTTSAAFAAKSKDATVATVNGTSISKNAFQNAYIQGQLYLSNKKPTPEKILNDLINREIGIQKARANKLDQDPIVREKINDILYHAQISKDLENEFTKISVSDKDVENFYKENKEYRTSHILFRLKADPTKEEVKTAMEAAYTLFAQAKQTPDKFNELANKYSQSTAAATGGDIGFQPPTRLAPEYYNAIKGKPVGAIIEPVRTQFGFHVIKILGIKKYDEISKDLYKKIIYDIRRDKMIEDYFEAARKKANIQVFKENL